jgi:drug/metabolite transporter (DMT)-like permease
MTMPPQLIALCASLSYAIAIVSARRGMKYSSPITVTCVSLMVHTVTLWAAVFFSGGIPDVAPVAVLLFVLAGVLQPVIRLFTYTGVQKIGASRSGPLRSTHPMFGVFLAITFLHEEATVSILLGTLCVVAGIILISWQPAGKLPSFRWWHVLFPLGASVLAGIVHPIRRYALTLSNHPLFFAALVGVVSLACLWAYLALPTTTERPLWSRRALGPFITAGVFETLGILLVITALSIGNVVIVSPLVAITPMWTLLGTALFLRDLERLNARTIFGTCSVVAGTIAISI